MAPAGGGAALCGQGDKRKLNRVGIFTIGEIARADRTLLRMLLGKWGDTLGTYARGEENAPVLRMGESAAVKSIGNSMTPPRDLLCPRDAELMFYVLAESVAARAARPRAAMRRRSHQRQGL